MKSVTIIATLGLFLLTACPIDQPTDPVSSSDTTGGGDATTQPTDATSPTDPTTPTTPSVPTTPGTPTSVCEQAIDRMLSCGVAPENAYFDGLCDSYDACESQCLLDGDCSIFGADRDPTAYAAYGDCLTSCYALGGGTCREAEMHVRLCGLDTSVGWNPDRFCNATEHCLAGCALGTKCLGLWGLGVEAQMYQACETRCLDANLTAGTLADPSAPHDYFCQTYPASDDCADPVAYCQTYASDPWCRSQHYACLLDPTATGCDTLLPYCAEHPDEARCSPVWPPATDYCASFPESPLCLDAAACAISPAPAGCVSFPAYCAAVPSDPYCFGTELFSDYCARYPDSPECFGVLTSFCADYPSAPLCDPGYVPYCDQYPNDPSCQEPDYSQRYCEWYPDSPECSTVYEPYCVQYPWDPSCP